MYKNKQPNNGSDYNRTHSVTFFKNVIIGAFLPRALSNSQIQKTHDSAKETHNQAVQLHSEIAEKIKGIELLLSKDYSPT